jgi:hypothetical protein
VTGGLNAGRLYSSVAQSRGPILRGEPPTGDENR